MDWQPIETAPKDGRWILAASTEYAAVKISWNFHHKDWARHGDKDAEPVLHQPTHWLPLPAPPEDGNE